MDADLAVSSLGHNLNIHGYIIPFLCLYLLNPHHYFDGLNQAKIFRASPTDRSACTHRSYRCGL